MAHADWIKDPMRGLTVMKYWPQSYPVTRATLVSAFFFVFQLPVFADFSGSDTLAADSSNWTPLFSDSDKGRLIFQHSRLEYWARDSDTSDHRAKVRWTPNKGSSNQDWFVEADVHLENYRLDSSRRLNLSIGVVNTKHHNEGYIVSIDRGTKTDHTSGFKASTLKEKSTQYSFSSATDATLRIHFDSKAGTLTGSWKTRGIWEYFAPFDVSSWDMNQPGGFNAILMGSGNTEDSDLYRSSSISSGDAYFRNFKCGNATPDIAVEQPAHNSLKDGRTKTSFGTAVVGGKGRAKTFTLCNKGTSNLRNLKISKDAANAADFQIAGLSKSTLAPGESTTFRVTFEPKATGTRNASIHISSNDPDESPFDISLTGEGVN